LETPKASLWRTSSKKLAQKLLLASDCSPCGFSQEKHRFTRTFASVSTAIKAGLGFDLGSRYFAEVMPISTFPVFGFNEP
jgi:hypothetical protein